MSGSGASMTATMVTPTAIPTMCAIDAKVPSTCCADSDIHRPRAPIRAPNPLRRVLCEMNLLVAAGATIPAPRMATLHRPNRTLEISRPFMMAPYSQAGQPRSS